MTPDATMNDEPARYASAFDALFEPEEAAHLRARADVMNALRAHVEAQGWTQAEAARHLGTTQPRVSALVRGQFNDFSLDALVKMAGCAGLRVRLEVSACESVNP